MRPLNQVFAACCLLSGSFAGVSLLADEPRSEVQQEFETRRAALHAETAGAFRELADWCIGQGARAEARRWLAESARLVPDAAEFAGLESRALGDDTIENPDRFERFYDRQRDRSLDGVTRAWGAFAGWAEGNGFADEATVAWEQVLVWDPDDRRAQRALGESGGGRNGGGQVDYARLAGGIEIDEIGIPASLRNDPRTARAREVFREMLPVALERNHAFLGVTLEVNDAFKVVFVANPPNGNALASAGSDDGRTIRVRVYVENWTDRKDPEWIRQTVIHEMTHAICMLRMGIGPYQSRQPKWFREGLAVYVAGQGPSRVAWGLRDSGGSIDRMLNGLESGEANQRLSTDYAEAYLAIRFLRERVGEDDFRKFIETVLAGRTTVESAIERASGLSFADFEREAHAYAREHHARIAAE